MSDTALDRQLIVEALARYAWGYDEGDFKLLADSFTQDATTGGKVAHTDIGWGPMRGRAQIVEVLEGIRKTQSDQRRHSIHTVRFHNQSATEADFSAYMHISGAENKVIRLVTAGWYRAQVVKEADGIWRMRNLDALLDAPF
ncbi:nuclear transport factor 2 family protein [Variovorax sp. J22R133]|uniref:nuclear transport factor 2 family protein n=1 Tax=Variovorax brevis TaxID=3053503 RepID=UPI0025773EFC|nr:nuclear transport factor 2 family protein [Variovorax sp. J22R133]MDM0116110.1 nuclear transport factor 2 family protein [Variovorax sp. J22R133]